MISILLLSALTVAFPRPGAKLPAVDRTYVIGATTAGTNGLAVQGRPVAVHPMGGWVTMVDCVPGSNRIEVVQRKGAVTLATNVVFFVERKREPGAAPAPAKVYEKLPYAGDAPRRGRQGVIVLDPGHGGSDTGAVSPHNLTEKNVNLRVAKMVKAELEKLGYRVLMTRDDDSFPALYDRPKLAHEKGAAAFVSIHHNAPPLDRDPRETRYHTVYAWNPIGEELAKSINVAMAAALGATLKDNGVQHANYAVTRNPEIPSCLIEVDFITTPEGEIDSWNAPRRRKIAAAIASGISDWVKAEPKAAEGNVVWLDELPTEGMDIGVMHFSPTRNSSVASTKEKPVLIKIGDRVFKRGLGSHAAAHSTYEIHGGAISFNAHVGVDAWVLGQAANGVKEDAKVRFRVVADKKTVAESPVMVSSTPAYELKADLRGAKKVELVIDDLGSSSWDIVVWGDARFILEPGAKIETWTGLEPQLGILTPKPSAAPRINGAKIFGVRPHRPILWRLPVTGERPMELSASGLPKGVQFDSATGLLSGSVALRGTYPIYFLARNSKGAASSVLKLVVGDQLALTPPMGWNSWNVFGSFVTAENIKQAADAFISTGLADHGWSYINIDDFWQNSVVKTDEKTLIGPLRDQNGRIVSNAKFPSMKGLADYIHSKGLKAGLYSSPSDRTCGGCEGSWGHEWKDAATYAEWGYDYLKYDGCSYAQHQVGGRLAKDFLPFRLMGEALAAQKRDIVYSINTFGDGSELTITSGGGAFTGAQCWRTTGDINDSWAQVHWIMRDQRFRWPYARPGAWNDPDMMVLGVIGGPWKFRRMSKLTPNMQYTHVSMWCILCSPLMIGCDLTKLDDLTLSLLTNDEVLETSQDELGAQAGLVAAGERGEIWAKPMSDGSYVLALVNISRKLTSVRADFAALGLEGEWRVRDLWRQRDVGVFSAGYKAPVPPLATHLVRLYPGKGARLRAGLTDIRMGGFYRLLEPTRPVGRPGFVPMPADFDQE